MEPQNALTLTTTTRRLPLHLHRSVVVLPDMTEVIAVSFDARDPYAASRLPISVYISGRSGILPGPMITSNGPISVCPVIPLQWSPPSARCWNSLAVENGLRWAALAAMDEPERPWPAQQSFVDFLPAMPWRGCVGTAARTSWSPRNRRRLWSALTVDIRSPCHWVCPTDPAVFGDTWQHDLSERHGAVLTLSRRSAPTEGKDASRPASGT